MFGQARRQGLLPRPLVDSRWPFGVPRAWDRLVVLANRSPYRHESAPNGHITQTRSTSGVISAIEPLVDACSGVWIARGASDDDRGGDVPVDSARCRVRYMLLDADEHQGFYNGFAQDALWPLCHSVNVPAVFRSGDFQHYEAVNSRFAAAAVQESGPGMPLVLVHGYHFGLAPRRVRKRLPAATIVAFWHIPWPHFRAFKTCPWHRELLDGLLGSDIVGFQTHEDAGNFIECARTLLRADGSEHQISYRGHETRVGVYPLGIEWNNAVARATPPTRACRAQVLRDFDLPDDVWLGIGVDRLDYTKGLNEKFLAIERALEIHPELRRRFAFVQVAEQSYECLPAYRDARARLRETTGRINGRFGSTRHTPIRLMECRCDPAEVYRLYRAADLCFVGSLHDGMNLVAKEFVAARDDERGVLLLSEFAGAAQQLRTALQINPYAIDATADALAVACTMPATEQAARMRLLRANVRASDTRWWCTRLLEDVSAVCQANASIHAPIPRVPSGKEAESGAAFAMSAGE